MAAELSFPWYNPVKLYVLYDDKSFILLDTFFFSVELMDRPGVVQEAVKCRVLRLLSHPSLTPSLPPSPPEMLGRTLQPWCTTLLLMSCSPEILFRKQSHSLTIIVKQMKHQIQPICLKVWERQDKKVTETLTEDQIGAPHPTSSKVSRSSWEKAVNSYLIDCFHHTVIPCIDTFLVKED